MLLPAGLLSLLLILVLPMHGGAAAPGPRAGMVAQDALTQDDALNLHCLRMAYPTLRDLERDAEGRHWLVFADGQRVLYRERPEAATVPRSALAPADVATTMAAPYPLEPARPLTPPGIAPGRARSYALLATLYGSSRETVGQGLVHATWPGRPVRLIAPAAQALERVSRRLAPVLAERPHLMPYLNSEGGFAWRRIAGEDRLSAHAFGIALDLNARFGPYWRWSSARPHPRQQDYPPEIVAAFEAEGFIWGGKWHEYDLMHFEYRPELICKARLAGTAPPAP